MSLIRVNIDGKEINTYTGHTILEVAKMNGVEIPTLCHNEKIKNYGSCGLCVVEVEGNPKLIRACSTEISDNMVINTKSNRIIESRKTTLELLLSDHTGDCKAPCTHGCPSQVDIQGYVGLIANKEYGEALKLIKEELPLPASIGRVCPHPCQSSCRRGHVDDAVSIAWLKRYVADLDLSSENPYMPEIKPSTGKKIAIIGGGPSGLSAAYFMRKEGHEVEIFEAMPEFGGMLKYGIPLYRLPKEVLMDEIDLIRKMGVKLTPNKRIGTDISFDHIKKEHDAVYVAIGAWLSAKLGVPGQDLDGVIGGIDFLTKFAINEPIKTGNKIAVIGGGNTAMDACRTAIRLGAKEVYAIYRRTKEDMPAVDVEIEEAEEEGVTFKFLLNPVEIIGDENSRVKQIRLQKMRVVKDEKTGKRSVVPIEGEEEILEVDSVIMSIGQKLKLDGMEELEANRWGNIKADENTYETNIPGVFAGGDAANDGASIAIAAIADGKNAARVIETYLNGNLTPKVQKFHVKREMEKSDFAHILQEHKAHMGHEAPELRRHNFEEVVYGYTQPEVDLESNRCLECGCMDYFECGLIRHSNSYDVEPSRLKGDKHDLTLVDDHQNIQRDPNKCILCGMCSRICDEVTDNTALGMIGRGFETVILPSMEKPLSETDCISCGSCVTVCPTGALTEKLPIPKNVPVKGTKSQTVCGGCSVGCSVEMESKGSLLLRALPMKGNVVNDGLLCARGRFGFDAYKVGERITSPLIRKGDELVPVSFKEALLLISRKAQSIHLINGSGSMGVSVSDRYSNEEIYMIKKLGSHIIGTNRIFSFNYEKSGLEDVFGLDASTNGINELLTTNLIVAILTEGVVNHGVIGLKIREATKTGVELININSEDSKLNSWANMNVKVDNDLELLKGILKHIIKELGKPAKYAMDGYEELIASLEMVEVDQNAADIADSIIRSRKCMFVFDEAKVTYEAEKLIAYIALMSENIGSPRSGIIKLRKNYNSQGLVDMGIDPRTNGLIDDLESGEIKGLMIFGENVADVELGNLEFLMVQDTHMTETALKADVILPKTAYTETSGSVTSLERRIQNLNPILESPFGKSNWKIVEELMNTFSTNSSISGTDEIFELICKEIPEYKTLHLENTDELYWPAGDERILYKNGFSTWDASAKLSAVKTGYLFKDPIETNILKSIFNSNRQVN